MMMMMMNILPLEQQFMNENFQYSFGVWHHVVMWFTLKMEEHGSP